MISDCRRGRYILIVSIVFQTLFTISASLFYVSVRESPSVLLLRKRVYSRSDTRRLSATEYSTMRPVCATAVRDFIVRSFLVFNRSVQFLFYTTRRNLHARRALRPFERASTLDLPLGRRKHAILSRNSRYVSNTGLLPKKEVESVEQNLFLCRGIRT